MTDKKNLRAPAMRLYADELIVDSFAGGGGASLGIEQALGRSPDIAINHDREAIAMHTVNHPSTKHFCEDVWKVDPVKATAGKPVGLMWLSPDCKHFSKAKGGKPVEKKIRGLAWVAVHWVKALKKRAPRVIVLENVEEFRDWGPVMEDGKPCPVRRGFTFRRFVKQLQNLGYAVEHRELVAADFGAPTSRKRLFLIARRDGLPIRWPEPTHGPGRALPWRTAAECIDWSIPCPSIFERERPLAENTMKRIARGVQKYVIDCPQPFIVRTAHADEGPNSRRRGQGQHSLDLPLPTVTASNDYALVRPFVPTLIQTGYGERPGQAPRVPGLEKPLGTCVDGQKHALVAAYIAKQNGVDDKMVVGQDLFGPVHTITATDQKGLVASTLVKLRGTSTAQGVAEPLHTISAQGTHFAQVQAFLVKFYSEGGQWGSLFDPMGTVTAKDRMGLVTVDGEPHFIADIGLRMLQPRELFRAQGFPDSYIIDRMPNGMPLPKYAQVRMCGNSVVPACSAALVRANLGIMAAEEIAA